MFDFNVASIRDNCKDQRDCRLTHQGVRIGDRDGVCENANEQRETRQGATAKEAQKNQKPYVSSIELELFCVKESEIANVHEALKYEIFNELGLAGLMPQDNGAGDGAGAQCRQAAKMPPPDLQLGRTNLVRSNSGFQPSPVHQWRCHVNRDMKMAVQVAARIALAAKFADCAAKSQ